MKNSIHSLDYWEGVCAGYWICAGLFLFALFSYGYGPFKIDPFQISFIAWLFITSVVMGIRIGKTKIIS